MDYTIPGPEETVKIVLTGRQCRALSYMFVDIGKASDKIPEMAQMVTLACRSIMTFASLYAGLSNDGSDEYIITVPVFQAHLIAFAITVYLSPRPILNHETMLDIVSAIDEGFVTKAERELEQGSTSDET